MATTSSNPPVGFSARLDTNERIGRLSFYKGFPRDLLVDGLHLGMRLDAVRALYPTLVSDPDNTHAGIVGYRCMAAYSYKLALRFKHEELVGFDLESPTAV